MITKEMKNILHYGEVRGDVLPPPHDTNTSCSSHSYVLHLTNYCEIKIFKPRKEVLLSLFMRNDTYNIIHALAALRGILFSNMSLGIQTLEAMNHF